MLTFKAFSKPRDTAFTHASPTKFNKEKNVFQASSFQMKIEFKSKTQSKTQIQAHILPSWFD